MYNNCRGTVVTLEGSHFAVISLATVQEILFLLEVKICRILFTPASQCDLDFGHAHGHHLRTHDIFVAIVGDRISLLCATSTVCMLRSSEIRHKIKEAK